MLTTWESQEVTSAGRYPKVVAHRFIGTSSLVPIHRRYPTAMTAIEFRPNEVGDFICQIVFRFERIVSRFRRPLYLVGKACWPVAVVGSFLNRSSVTEPIVSVVHR